MLTELEQLPCFAASPRFFKSVSAEFGPVLWCRRHLVRLLSIQHLSPEILCGCTHDLCLEKPQGQQKLLKSQNLSSATTRAGRSPCATKAPCSQALLVPTKGDHSAAPPWHPPSIPAHSVKSNTGSPAMKEKSKGSQQKKKTIVF